MKFHSIKYDENDILFCYLYLKNKTFLNAHLLKNGLVEPDSEHSYKYKTRFISYWRTQNGERMDS